MYQILVFIFLTKQTQMLPTLLVKAKYKKYTCEKKLNDITRHVNKTCIIFTWTWICYNQQSKDLCTRCTLVVVRSILNCPNFKFRISVFKSKYALKSEPSDLDPTTIVVVLS